jgi:uncharacterized protein Usg
MTKLSQQIDIATDFPLLVEALAAWRRCLDKRHLDSPRYGWGVDAVERHVLVARAYLSEVMS